MAAESEDLNGHTNCTEKCVICLDEFDIPVSCDHELGVRCSATESSHFVCCSDLRKYVAEVVLRRLYEVQSTLGCIPCPEPSCSSHIGLLQAFNLLDSALRSRFLSTVERGGSISSGPADEYSGDIARECIPQRLRKIRSMVDGLLDLLTLKCPHCNVAVDPFPDACSAVMCLCCGHYYCNFCFRGFNCGDGNKDRADAHTHVAEHKQVPQGSSETRDAFLSPVLTRQGQQQRQRKLLLRYITLALTSQKYSTENSKNGFHDFQLVLIFCFDHIHEMGIDVWETWKDALHAARSGNKGSLDEDSSAVETGSAITRDNLHGKSYDERVNDTGTAIHAGRQLAVALLTQNQHAARALLSSPELDVNYIDGSQLTRHQREQERRFYPLLSLAILTHQDEIALELIKRGADVTIGDLRLGRSSLYIAIESGRRPLVDAILDTAGEQIDLNKPVTSEKGQHNSLHVAAIYNRANLIPLLISKGAIVDSTEAEGGLSALALAISHRNLWAASVLMDCGADLLSDSIYSACPAVVAARIGLLTLVEAALDKCEDIIRRGSQLGSGERQDAAVSQMMKRSKRIRVLMLHAALQHLQSVVVDRIISRYGATVVNAPDQNGCPPIFTALVSGCESDALNLLRVGANAHIHMPKSMRFPIFVAVERGMYHVVEALLAQHQVNVNASACCDPNQPPYTPLHLAILNNKLNLVPLLMRYGAHIDATECVHNHTALLIAVLKDNLSAVHALVSFAPNPYLMTKENRNALYIAAERGQVDILKVLISDLGMSVNDRTDCAASNHRLQSRGMTALHVACSRGRVDCVHFLLHVAKADPQPRDHLGQTPLDYLRAAQGQNQIVCRMILESYIGIEISEPA